MMIDALYNYRQGDIHAAEFFIIHAEFQCCDFSGKMRGAVICFKGSVVGRCAFGIVNCGIKANRTIFRIGFTPVSTRAFGDTEIEPFRSVEWQAKAYRGEIPCYQEIGRLQGKAGQVEKVRHFTKGRAIPMDNYF